MYPLNRQQWSGKVAVCCAVLLSLVSEFVQADEKQKTSPRRQLPVAAIVTEYRTNSHADVIVGKILEGYRQDGGPGPDLRIVSMYRDQVPAQDLSQDLAKKHGFLIAKTIEEAIVAPSGEDQIAGVLSIGEHGTYPSTPDTGQLMYPRRRFFDEIVAAMKKTGRIVPVFNDKHLAYSWEDAKHMYDTAKKLQMPFLAGSSLPVTWREPTIDLPMGCEIEEALVSGYGGLEAYGFHSLESLQSVVERRRGGETGVWSVQAVRGDQIEKAESEGRWSRSLLNAVLRASGKGDLADAKLKLNDQAAIYLVEYRDGFRGSVVMAPGVFDQWMVAVKLRGKEKPFVTWMKTENKQPYGHFEFLVKAIDHTIHTGRPAYPVERTLLTTGVLDAVMHSLMQDGKRIATPELAIQYRSADWAFGNRSE